jgi:hypothetical protein
MSPNQNPPIVQPNVHLKQNDLAAVSLVGGIAIVTPSGDSRNNLVATLMATCKNLGTKPYKPGFRRLNILYSKGGVEGIAASRVIPELAAGKSYSFTYTLSGIGADEYWLEVSEGNRPDDDPDNDVFVPEAPEPGRNTF